MGELAALVTSALWSLTSVQFTLAGRRVGSPVVNRTRLVLAVLYLSVAHWLLFGRLWPAAEPSRWLWLSASGIVGLVLGDASLFQAYVVIGPRRSQLVMTSVPVITTAVAWVWLGETLRPAQLAAMAVTIGGIAWAVSAPRQVNGRVRFAGDTSRRAYALGVLLAFGGALGQSFGLLLARPALADGFAPLSATWMRMAVGMTVIWVAAMVSGRAGPTVRAWRDRRALGFIASAAFTGPFLGVWLSMVAVQNAALGVASTLMALPPVLLIPLSRWVFGERITWRALLGTVVALAGAATLFLA